MFGESNIGDTGHEGHNKAAAMADSDEVCGCNGVNKGTICKAIKDKGLFTLEEVRKHTKASACCGSCTGLVEQMLMFTAGGDYSRGAEEEGDVRLHRRQPPGGARRDPRASKLLTHRRASTARWAGARPTAARAAARRSTTT